MADNENFNKNQMCSKEEIIKYNMQNNEFKNIKEFKS